MRPASRIGFAVCICPLALIAACENSRTPVPAVQQGGSAAGFRMLHYPAAGISFRAPSDWSAAEGQGPLIATLTSGTSVVAVWRFPRSIDPPAGTTALRRARRQLIRKARHRDPRLTLIRSTITAVSGVPAIEIDAVEQIAGHSRRVRSTHVFERRAEIVLDEYAPPQAFHAVDHAVFSPVKRSLLLSGTSTA